MDDLFGLLALLLLFFLLGGALGFVAWFKARRALAEIAVLRARLDAMAPAGTPIEAALPPVPSPWEQSPVPAPVAESLLPEPPPPPAPEPRKRRDIEDLLTLRWGVWLGAAALVLAGVFLVRYAVDQGLLGPAIRCLLMVVLAVFLMAAAEWLRRRPALGSASDTAPPALAASGVAILFGAAFAAAVLYELVPPLIGFGLMAAASLAGLAFSLRMGQLVAAVGLIGAFVTPLLVQTESASLPGLFLYLLFVAAASLAVIRFTAWAWLGWWTTLACAFWVLLASFSDTATTTWAPSLFVPAAAALNLALLPPTALDHPVGRKLAWIPFAALGAAGLFLAFVTADPTARAGVLLLAPLAVAKGAREPRLDRLPWLAALLFLLAVLGWGLPEWRPTGETIAITNVVQAVLPGAWVPDVLRPLLWTSGLMALFFTASGLWLETRAERPLRWAALPAAVPVLTLALLYTRVKLFQPDAAWAAAALAVAILLTGTAARALSRAARQVAGAHAAGAGAALALGLAMLLSDQWLTLAISLLLPALAWIAAQTDLPALRRVALALAALILVRLTLNWYVLDYAIGTTPVINGLLPAYLVPACAFALSARMFRQRGSDLTVDVLDMGSFALVTVLIALEIRQWATGGALETHDFSFLEAALHITALAAQARLALALSARTPRPALNWVWQVQGTLALIGGFLLILLNPMVLSGTPVGGPPIFNALLLAYAVPALLAASACWHKLIPHPHRILLATFALAATFTWITLEVRHLFHPILLGLDDAPIGDAELWAWSGAWLVFGLALMAAGLRTGIKPLRLTALAVVALVGAKAFLIDMSGLAGLWRVLSFLGLGLTLIALAAGRARVSSK